MITQVSGGGGEMRVVSQSKRKLCLAVMKHALRARLRGPVPGDQAAILLCYAKRSPVAVGSTQP